MVRRQFRGLRAGQDPPPRPRRGGAKRINTKVQPLSVRRPTFTLPCRLYKGAVGERFFDEADMPNSFGRNGATRLGTPGGTVTWASWPAASAASARPMTLIAGPGGRRRGCAPDPDEALREAFAAGATADIQFLQIADGGEEVAEYAVADIRIAFGQIDGRSANGRPRLRSMAIRPLLRATRCSIRMNGGSFPSGISS